MLWYSIQINSPLTIKERFKLTIFTCNEGWNFITATIAYAISAINTTKHEKKINNRDNLRIIDCIVCLYCNNQAY